jgi:hypothetical protein
MLCLGNYYLFSKTGVYTLENQLFLAELWYLIKTHII